MVCQESNYPSQEKMCPNFTQNLGDDDDDDDEDFLSTKTNECGSMLDSNFFFTREEHSLGNLTQGCCWLLLEEEYKTTQTNTARCTYLVRVGFTPSMKIFGKDENHISSRVLVRGIVSAMRRASQGLVMEDWPRVSSFRRAS